MRHVEIPLNPHGPRQDDNTWTDSHSIPILGLTPILPFGDWAWQQQIFYRNVNEQTILSSYKFGINIVYYLLTRYEDRFIRMSSGTI